MEASSLAEHGQPSGHPRRGLAPRLGWRVVARETGVRGDHACDSFNSTQWTLTKCITILRFLRYPNLLCKNIVEVTVKHEAWNGSLYTPNSSDGRRTDASVLSVG